MKWMFFFFLFQMLELYFLCLKKKWQTFSYCFERDMINAWFSWFYSPTLVLLTPDFNLWDAGSLFHCQGVCEVIYSDRTNLNMNRCKTHILLKCKLNIHSGLPGTVTADLNLISSISTIMQIRFFIPFKSPCFSLVPTNLTYLTNLSYDLSQMTPVYCFFPFYFVFSLSSVHSHSYLRYTNDCMIAIAAQLWNQGDPRVLDATVLSLTTNELCASLTVLIGICLAVTEPARH